MKKKSKEEVSDFKFKAKDLIDKDEKSGFKSSFDSDKDQEKIDTKFKKEMDKIEKFESFLKNKDLSWKDASKEEIEKSSIPAYKDLDFVKSINKCNCCDECTGEPGCYCGCENCTCDEVSKFESFTISENVKYHLENNKPITENIFRPGSNSFYESIKEARRLFETGLVNFCDIDKELFESTDIGRFAKFNGEIVPLDIPMEHVEDINEAEYKGKEVKLNYPMRGGSKKYYVYVKTPKGNVKKISFGDTTGLSAKVSNPEARKSFAARHKCSTKKDKTKAGYWACRLTKYGHLWNGRTYPGYW